jgi:uncharacterized protein (TIGR03382 family)
MRKLPRSLLALLLVSAALLVATVAVGGERAFLSATGPTDTSDTSPGDSGDSGDSGHSGHSGDSGGPPPAIDLDGDGFTSVQSGGDDCDDHNLASFPGAPEIADHADNDCDGTADEGTWLGDDDGDGSSEVQGDCDDSDPERHPGAPDDDKDGVDDDCDGQDDAALATDQDGDGVTAAKGDCNDLDPDVNPSAFDGMDGVDDDCDGVTDGDELAKDLDGDGMSPIQGDCDETDISIAATFPEKADDFIDQDCDGSDLYDVDADGDPSPASGGTDCDDDAASVHPGATEVCDGADNDCDGRIDEACVSDSDDLGLFGPDHRAITEDCNCGNVPGPGPGGLGVLLLATAWLVRRRGTG